MTYMTSPATTLPDPDYDADFYRDVVTKRGIAWLIDIALISAIVGVLIILSLFIALIFLPVVYFFTSFVYRWLSLAAWSGTPGMRMMAIQLRAADGRPLDGLSAFLHTTGYAISIVTFPLQMISVVMMLTTPRKQGLSDMILGTAMLNRPAR